MTKQLPEEISGALYLSYADLPSPLKQCFLYCSLYPQDSSIARLELVRLWVAEGFIKEEGDSLMEDTAEEYFYELTMRSLLLPYTLGTLLRATFCVWMHISAKCMDLFRALALFISRDESFSGNVTENAAGFLGATTEPKCLRTLINFKGPTLDFKLLVRFLHLRLLIITDNEIECIPDSIGDLVHLRLVDISRTLIRQLPESMGRLSNFLQFLDLRGRKYLTILPRSITQLHKLRCLVLSDTPLISFIPKGIERLKQLNDLRGFVVGDEEEHNTLKELSSLSNMITISDFYSTVDEY